MAELMMWRVHQSQRFGERQIAIHTANKLQAAIRIQEDLHAWARACDYRVNQRTGQERITLPDHSRWEITSLKAAYGSRPSFVFVDEAFDVPRALVEKALLPAQARRRQPQLWLVSTANTECTDLMLEYMTRAQQGSDRVCLIDYGLPPGADPLNREWWPASNPAPTDAYLDMVEANVGGADWEAQWLNVWPQLAVETGWLAPERWHALAWRDPWPDSRPCIAVEVSPDQRWAAARAVRIQDRLIVEALEVDNPTHARDQVAAWWRPDAKLIAGASAVWALDPRHAPEPVTHTKHYAEASAVFVAQTRAAVLAHIPEPALDRQVCAMQHKGVGNAGILRGSPDVVARSAVWAVWAAHQRPDDFLIV